MSEEPDTENNITDESSDKKYFTLVPRIVNFKCRSAYDENLWKTIKEVVGEMGGSGVCRLTTESLAILSKMSVGQVSKSRKNLLDAGLIKGQLKPVEHSGTGKKSKPQWHLTIPDLWAENLEYCKRYPTVKARIQYLKLAKNTPNSPDENGGSNSPHEFGSNSPHESSKDLNTAFKDKDLVVAFKERSSSSVESSAETGSSVAKGPEDDEDDFFLLFEKNFGQVKQTTKEQILELATTYGRAAIIEVIKDTATRDVATPFQYIKKILDNDYLTIEEQQRREREIEQRFKQQESHQPAIVESEPEQADTMTEEARVILEDLRSQMPQATYETWIQGLQISVNDLRVGIQSHDQGKLDWIQNRLGNKIQRFVNRQFGDGAVVEYSTI